MATSSILEHITINNPHFMEMYADHIDASTGISEFKRRTSSNIIIGDEKDWERLSELRRKNGLD